MDITLLLITLVSLAAAAASLVAARRLKHQDRQRSDARVAALAAASLDDVHLPERRPPAATPRPKTTFAFDDFRTEDFGTAHEPVSSSAPSDDSLFGTVQRETSHSGRFAFVAAAALLVALGGAFAVFTSSGNGKTSVAAGASHSEPLELVSLGHLRDASNLTISGIVRNPSSGPKVEGLTAVVSLIDAHGGLISTKDVPLDYRALGPGEEAPFKVSIPDPGSVARYRVSFRAGTEIVPHVDRRSGNKLASAL